MNYSDTGELDHCRFIHHHTCHSLTHSHTHIFTTIQYSYRGLVAIGDETGKEKGSEVCMWMMMMMYNLKGLLIPLVPLVRKICSSLWQSCCFNFWVGLAGRQSAFYRSWLEVLPLVDTWTFDLFRRPTSPHKKATNHGRTIIGKVSWLESIFLFAISFKYRSKFYAFREQVNQLIFSYTS